MGMNKAETILMVGLVLGTGIAGAQNGTGQPPATSPVPAYGQETPAAPVSENPPISAIDLPGLEPHAAPESFLLAGLHFSESLDSNEGNELGGSSFGAVTRALGGVTLQRLWKRYDLAMDYVGGIADYTRSNIGVQLLQQLDIDNRINWKRGQFAIRDSFSYLPEGTFGGGSYGGMGFGGAGLLGASAFGGQSNTFFGGTEISLGVTPRLMNLGMADVVEQLTPKSAITGAASYGLAHFFGNVETAEGENLSFIGSREYTATVAYDRILNSRNQVALSYGYQVFNFVDVGTELNVSVIQAMYGHRVSGRMDFLISAGPQFINISSFAPICTDLSLPVSQCPPSEILDIPLKTNYVGLAGRMLLRYRLPKTGVTFSVQRFVTDGSGLFAGSETTTAHLEATRPVGHNWDAYAYLGFSKNTRLETAASAVNANSYTDGYAGLGVHRQMGRSIRAFVSYQFNELGFDNSCPLPGTSGTACSHISSRQIGTVGVDWTMRPVRLD
jgi:hypothetical protein